MPDIQPENYRKCSPDSCGYCRPGKQPNKVLCAYAVFEKSGDSEETFERNSSCKFNLLEIRVLAQRRAK